MDDAPPSPLTTREFAVRWHTLVEEHSVNRLAQSLSQLAPIPSDAVAPPAERYAELAGHLFHALQVATGPTGGVEEGIRYMVQAAAERGRQPGSA
jgi:hypothetical protein